MITLEEAKQNQQALQQAASGVLEQYQITELLSKYGQVVAEGSYSYGLMVYPDIDLLVINSDINTDHVIELAKTLFQTEGINHASMSDFTATLRDRYTKNGEGPPYGFYVKTNIFHEDSSRNLDIWQWKLDIWLVPEKPKNTNRTKGLESADWFEKRTEEEKDAMLLLKAQLWEKGYYIHKGIGSFHVYRAVIEGIRTVDDFFEWMKENYNYKLS